MDEELTSDDKFYLEVMGDLLLGKLTHDEASRLLFGLGINEI